MFKIECQCGASNVIEEAEHLESDTISIKLDRDGKIEVYCWECSHQVKSD